MNVGEPEETTCLSPRPRLAANAWTVAAQNINLWSGVLNDTSSHTTIMADRQPRPSTDEGSCGFLMLAGKSAAALSQSCCRTCSPPTRWRRCTPRADMGRARYVCSARAAHCAHQATPFSGAYSAHSERGLHWPVCWHLYQVAQQGQWTGGDYYQDLGCNGDGNGDKDRDRNCYSDSSNDRCAEDNEGADEHPDHHSDDHGY